MERLAGSEGADGEELDAFGDAISSSGGGSVVSKLPYDLQQEGAAVEETLAKAAQWLQHDVKGCDTDKVCFFFGELSFYFAVKEVPFNDH